MKFKLHHYAGWIEGPESDRGLLTSLGVTGPMRHSGKVFEHCHVADDETMKKLIDNYPTFWPNAFTAVDKDGNQPSVAEVDQVQKWWRYREHAC